MEAAEPVLRALKGIDRDLKLLVYQVREPADDRESAYSRAVALVTTTAHQCAQELDKVRQDVAKLAEQKSREPSPIVALLDHEETKEGLVGWLEDGGKARGLELVANLGQHFAENNESKARKAVKNMIQVILSGLETKENEPSENRDDRSLGKLVDDLKAALEYNIDRVIVSGGADDGLDTSVNANSIKKDWDRLRRALRTIKLLDKRLFNQNGELGYLKQQEFVGAMAVMAQTLPIMHSVHERCTVPQADEPAATRTVISSGPPADQAELKSLSAPTPPLSLDTQRRANEVADKTEMEGAMAQPPVIPKYQRRLEDLGFANLSLVSSIAEELGDAGHAYRFMVKGIIECLRINPKAWLCSQGTKCPGRSNGSCAESHRIMEVMSHLPLYKLLPCPLPSHQDVKPKSLSKQIGMAWCVFHHGALPVTIDWMATKKRLCMYRLECINARCYKSHSLQEVCWFFPFFRTRECREGDSCNYKKSCGYTHQGQIKRKPMDSFIASTTETIPFIERTHGQLAARLERTAIQLQTYRANSELSGIVTSPPTEYERRIQKLGYMDADVTEAITRQSGTQGVMYSTIFFGMIETLKINPAAWICRRGPRCPDHINGSCVESHAVLEVMAHLPLYKLLPCRVRSHMTSNDPLLRSECVFHHNDLNVVVDWMKAKMSLCGSNSSCTDSKCRHSHSPQELCWYCPFYRTKDCSEGASCKKGRLCNMAHRKKEKRLLTDGFADPKFKALFVKRTHAELAQQLEAADPRFQ